MADNGRWFKLWCSSVHDPDMDNLTIENFGRWAKLGAITKEQGCNGVLTIYEPSRLLCTALQVTSFSELISIVGEMPNVTVTPVTSTPVSYRIEFKNWHKYQGDYSGDRVKKYRSKNRTNVTPKKRGEEKRGEENKKRRKPSLSSLSLSDFLTTLKSKPAYKNMDLETEWSKCETWCETKGFKLSYRRFVNWINRADKPVSPSTFKNERF